MYSIILKKMSQKTVRNTLPKEERLCAEKRIESLFTEGKSFIAYPLRIVYKVKEKEEEDNISVSILISVSKRKFKRAVKRNRVKRLVREAYRLNKTLLVQEVAANNKNMDIAFLYLKNELPDYHEIEKAMLKTISLLSEKIQESKRNADNS